ncbi:uncharacterized protein LOC6546206 [Drosophila erecta]|uniref:Uncharacterized protein n=1 Tax=Drosophila erecta TaxID=7220 RepID=B3NBY3_DROER|nr:uncharacterized protein LOC6546206 [Drosophila erecta]EDV50800.1 uncharacterized protein Dere_GG15152 [Drosophila erecta]
MLPETRRNERIQRDEVERLLRNPSNKPERMLFFLDTRYTSEGELRNSSRVMPDIHIVSGPALPNSRSGPFLPLNLSNANSWAHSVMLQIPMVRLVYPRRVRYTCIQVGRNVIVPEDISGLIVMAMIVNPEIDTLMGLDPIKAMSLILRIANYFLH